MPFLQTGYHACCGSASQDPFARLFSRSRIANVLVTNSPYCPSVRTLALLCLIRTNNRLYRLFFRKKRLLNNKNQNHQCLISKIQILILPSTSFFNLPITFLSFDKSITLWPGCSSTGTSCLALHAAKSPIYWAYVLFC